MILDVDPRKLIDYKNNSKEHSKYQINNLARSFKEEGFHGVIIVDENYEIIAGHGRKLAAIEAGLQTVPIQILKGLTEDQKISKRLGDNKLSESIWIDENLKQDLNFLKNNNYDLTLSGFDLSFLDDKNEILDREIESKNIFEIVVECENELEQKELYDTLINLGKKCRVLSM